MGFLTKFAARVVMNGAALYVAKLYFPKFILGGGWETIIAGAVVLAILNTFLRPVIKLISAPLLWITFGLFNIVVHVLILWIADKILLQLAITDLATLFWVSIVVAIANSFL